MPDDEYGSAEEFEVLRNEPNPQLLTRQHEDKRSEQDACVATQGKKITQPPQAVYTGR